MAAVGNVLQRQFLCASSQQQQRAPSALPVPGLGVEAVGGKGNCHLQTRQRDGDIIWTEESERGKYGVLRNPVQNRYWLLDWRGDPPQAAT